jgi:hypothetical protein
MEERKPRMTDEEIERAIAALPIDDEPLTAEDRESLAAAEGETDLVPAHRLEIEIAALL